INEFKKLLVIKCFRPDRLLAATSKYIDHVFTPNFVSQSELDFTKLVQDEVKASTPISLCSVPGHDAAYRVDNLAQEQGVRLASVAMGSQEGIGLADQAIASATKTGNWVLLKNVHLALSWLGQLDKRLHSLKAHPSFRLFLTMETNPKVPVNLLRLSRVLMFEPQPGIKANLQESLRGIPAARLSKGPTERVRLYFMVAWLHAVVLERLRYVPLGWTKAYEFNDSDQDCALSTIDNWLDTVGAGRANVSPDRIPWDAIRTLLSQSVYGGRVDEEADQLLLESFVSSFFKAECFDLSFKLVESDGEDSNNAGLVAPEGTKMAQFLGWVDELPEREPPTWLRLPPNAERVLSTHKAITMLSKVKKIKSLVDDDDDDL
ncbi:hypothetical protein BGX28_005310, partial [Mortierella sp. GBA30]